MFQYVSCSADRSIRIWNAWKMPKPKRKSSKGKRQTDLFNEAQLAQKKKDTSSKDKESSAVMGKQQAGAEKDVMAVIMEVDEADMEVGEEAINM